MCVRIMNFLKNMKTSFDVKHVISIENNDQIKHMYRRFTDSCEKKAHGGRRTVFRHGMKFLQESVILKQV